MCFVIGIKGLRCLLITWVLLSCSVGTALAQSNKRVGIVYSEPSANLFYEKFSYNQLFMSIQNQARMAGIPYDLLNENDLTSASNLAAYDALIIPNMPYVTASRVTSIESALDQAVLNRGMGLIVAGDFMTHNEQGNSLNNPYSRMQKWLGIEYASSVNGVAMNIRAQDINHPVMTSYIANELILAYDEIWFDAYRPLDSQNTNILAKLQVGGQTYNGVLASQGSSRNVHFANEQVLADTNIAWAALNWVIFGEETSVGLKLGRQDNIFIARNDMDQSMFIDELNINNIPLYDLLVDWKNEYNFVGSYYINIGNNPSAGEVTDWSISGPLYTNYITLGNEIGTHSWTHPGNTSGLNNVELEYEFNQSRLEIGNQLNIDVLGAAIPGNPENLIVNQQLDNYFSYISGRSGTVGSGYSGAFGRMTPDANSLYFSLNLSPDFTLIDDLKHSAIEAEQIWQDEFTNLLQHASQPIIHWLWHDYGPTSAAVNGNYSVDMFTNTIALAHANDAEFVTVADLQSRIRAFETASLTVTGNNPVQVEITAGNIGQFSLQVQSSQVINHVDNWYAYDDDQVFVPINGGQFNIHLGNNAEDVTHITAMPMRAKLLNLSGDGNSLAFSIDGEGVVNIHLSALLSSGLLVEGGGSHSQNGNQLAINFDSVGNHSVTLIAIGNTNLPPTASSQSITIGQDTTIAITLSGSDPEGQSLSYTILNSPANGQLTGSAPNLSYTPTAGYSGSDSFTFTTNDGELNSAAAKVSITINADAVNQPPTANSQSITTGQDSAIAITLSGSDSEGQTLSYTIVSSPTNGQLTGSAPNLSYAPAAGYSGSDSFTFTTNDGELTSTAATVAITIKSSSSGPSGGISNPTNGITVDGSLSDWSGVTSFGVDPDDVSGTNNLINWSEGWIAHDDNNFYLAYQNYGAITLSWGHNLYIDTDGNIVSGYNNGGANPVGAEYLIQESSVYQYTGDGSSWSWAYVGDLNFVVNNNVAEFSLPKIWLGDPTQLQLFFVGENAAYSGGSTEDYYPDAAADSSASNRFFIYSTNSVAINQPPTASSQSITTSQDSAVAITLSGSDPEGQSLNYTVISSPTNGQLSGSAPNLSYAPAVDYSGSDSFTFITNDGELNSASATVSITVNMDAVNLPPTASSQSITTGQDSAVAITLSGSDPEGQSLSYTTISRPANGQLTGSAPNLNYTPAAGYSGSDSFTFMTNDGELNSASATVTITVNSSSSGSGGGTSNPTNGIAVDGSLSDWNGVTSFGVDPDDVSGANNLINWSEGWIAHDDNNFYLAYQNYGAITLSWGHNLYLDTDGNPASGYNNGGANPVGAEYLIQESSVYQYAGDGSSWSWSFVGDLNFVVNNNVAEFSLPKIWLGDPAQLQLFFIGENVAYSGGSTEDYYPDAAADSSATNRFFTYKQ